MKKLFALAMLSLVVSAGFAQTERVRTGGSTTYTESSARNIEPARGVIAVPLIADLKVISNERIEPYEEIFPYQVNAAIVNYVPSFKRTAFFNAAKKYNADALVGALIDVSTTEDGYLKISVTGYPARYTNFRNATAQDVWMKTMYEIIDNRYDNDVFMAPDVSKINISVEKGTEKEKGK